MVLRPRDFQPRDYQFEIMARVMHTHRCAVFAPPGAGKTIATLDALRAVSAIDPIWPVLVISTLRVAAQVWTSEPRAWAQTAHLIVSPIIGTVEQRRAALRVRAHIYTINFESLEWLIDILGDAWPFRCVIVDESTRLAGYRTKQGTKRARRLAARAWHPNVTRLIELTGTPTINGLSKLWGPMWFIDRGARLGASFAAFESRWFFRGRDGYSIKPFAHALDECKALISDITTSIDIGRYMSLPPVIDVPIVVRMPAHAMKAYKAMQRDLEARIGVVDVTADSALTKSGKLMQIAAGAIYPDPTPGDDGSPQRARKPGEWLHVHDAKLDALRDLIAELNGAPLIVGYWWKSDLERLRVAFPDARVLDRDPATVDAWNAGRITLLLANPASAGHGLSLQHGGNALCWFSVWHDGELYSQLVDRIGPLRQLQSGYNRRVIVYQLIAENTIDATVLDRIATRQQEQARFLAS
ncbi:MAG: SNF2-related protein [Polynucleobacter sp.]